MVSCWALTFYSFICSPKENIKFESLKVPIIHYHWRQLLISLFLFNNSHSYALGYSLSSENSENEALKQYSWWMSSGRNVDYGSDFKAAAPVNTHTHAQDDSKQQDWLSIASLPAAVVHPFCTLEDAGAQGIFNISCQVCLIRLIMFFSGSAVVKLKIYQWQKQVPNEWVWGLVELRYLWPSGVGGSFGVLNSMAELRQCSSI